MKNTVEVQIDRVIAEKIESLERQIEDLEDDLHDAQERAEDLDSENSRLSLRVEELEAAEDAIYDRISDEVWRRTCALEDEAERDAKEIAEILGLAWPSQPSDRPSEVLLELILDAPDLSARYFGRTA